MTLKKAGFFRELRHGDPDGPSLAKTAVEDDRARIVAYLEAAPVLATTGMRVGDVLEPSRSDVAELAVKTDGTWLWPADFSYYVEEHGAAVPRELVEHMRALGWTPPALSDADLRSLEDRMPQISGAR
jgi:hypothetical protein